MGIGRKLDVAGRGYRRFARYTKARRAAQEITQRRAALEHDWDAFRAPGRA